MSDVATSQVGQFDCAARDALESVRSEPHIEGMRLKLWIASYLAVAAVAIVGVWLDCFSYSLLIMLGLILWIAPDPAVILTIRRFRKGQSQ
jgi:hypothetical protein